jgi:tetratricopeptide (TPR) repeat protein
LALAEALHATPPEDVATLLKSATAFHRKGDYAHSIPILRRIVQASPGNYDANLLLGEDLLHGGNMEGALAPLQVASEARPQDGTALAFLAEAAAGLRDYGTAAEAFQSAVARSSQSEQFLVAWADFSLDRSHFLGMYLRTNRRGEATMLRVTAAGRPEADETRESLLEDSAAKDPDQRGIWGELGRVQLALGRQSKALESLKEAERREPQEASTLRLEALFAAVEQRWPDAEGRLTDIGARSPAELRRVLAAWPGFLVPGPEVAGTVWDCLRHATAGCSLTSAQPQGGDDLSPKELFAEGRWEQLTALPPKKEVSDGFQSLWRGVALAETGACPQAIPSLERGLRSDERTGGFWLQVCYAGEGDRVVAKLRAMGDEIALHELKGDMLLRLRNDAAAAEFEYAEALKGRPRDAKLLARLADACQRLGDAEQARKTAQAAVALDPQEFTAMHTLALLAMNERNYAEALTRLKRLVAMNPNDDWTRVQLGVANSQSGHSEEAVRYLEPELAAGYPDPKGALHALLASALRKLGRADEAKQAAAQAARLADASLHSSENEKADAPQ